MHTTEAAVLIPLGIGLILLTIFVTFAFYDSVVLTAESSVLLLEWQEGSTFRDSEEELRNGFSALEGKFKQTKVTVESVLVTDLYAGVTLKLTSHPMGWLGRLIPGLSAGGEEHEKRYDLVRGDYCLTGRLKEALK